MTDGVGRTWQGTSIDVSPLGMQVKLTEKFRPHRFLLLSLTPPDGKGPLWVGIWVVNQHSKSVYRVQFGEFCQVAAQRLGSLLEPQLGLRA